MRYFQYLEAVSLDNAFRELGALLTYPDLPIQPLPELIKILLHITVYLVASANISAASLFLTNSTSIDFRTGSETADARILTKVTGSTLTIETPSTNSAYSSGVRNSSILFRSSSETPSSCS
ncbi:hypothetical protein Igag_1259 [Ignisphaera aggregans DSM 17230]|uniref:Uncharacterized protein n=1 Tax=Ignisphaera aggregans (strain DSM 17230 / JCM 13409 / AQ1.S1) TaxID=583356 RepID=E0SPK9_IGNAA|nr:hypothetical protein Igag_1259 [Ignisphaera aggregans DSM 17230]